MNEFKKHIFKTCFGLVVVLGLLAFSCHSSCWVVRASAVEEEIEVEDTSDPEEVVEESIPEASLPTPETGVSAVPASETVLLEFQPLSLKAGEIVDFEDLYNVLVHIYNFMLMSFIVGLIIWTHSMLTKAFRRFIY